MRLRFWGIVVLILLLSVLTASADTVTFGSIVYVYPEEAGVVPTLTISVQGETIDPETYQPVRIPALSGAVFGVYAKGAGGEYVPYPDPSDPTQPLKVLVGDVPLSVELPQDVDLYIRQDSAAEGFVPGGDALEYRPISVPVEITYTNYQQGMQGVRLTLSADGDRGQVALQDIEFSLEGAGGAYTLVTDEAGVAVLFDIPAGDYALRQRTIPQGYSIDRPQITITIEENLLTRLELHNSRDGSVTLRVSGQIVDAALAVQVIPLQRGYEIFDAYGNSRGILFGESVVSLPATQEGVRYTLRAADTPIDGFAQDEQEYEIVVHSGENVICEVSVKSDKGFFAFENVSAADGAPVSGGTFAVLDRYGNEMLTFEAGRDGRFMPENAIAPGSYSVRMIGAAENTMYTDRIVPFVVESYLMDDSRPIARVVFESPEIPQAMREPFVTAEAYALPSLFDKPADIDFTFRLLGGNAPLPYDDLAFDFTLSEDMLGLDVIEKREDGAHITIARRVPADHIEEIFALIVSGRVRYTFTYPVSETETNALPVDAPFTATIATFANTTRTQPYAAIGHVTDGAGASVAGIRVTLEDASGIMLYDEMVTDAFGAYAFEQMPIDSVIRYHTPDGYGVRVDGFDAVMLPLETYTGHVIVHGALEGYPVTLTYGDARPQAPDADGRFAFIGVFSPVDELTVETPAGVLSRIEIANGESIVHLYAAATVAGVSKDSEGKIVPGVQIALSGEGVALSTESGEDGAFAFDGLYPGNYTLSYRLPEGYLPDENGASSLTLEAGARLNEAVLLLLPGTIEGVLTDSGTPVAGAQVVLSPSGQQTRTDDSGRFVFEGLKMGEYTLSFALSGNAVVSNPPRTVQIERFGQKLSYALDVVRPATLIALFWDDKNNDGAMNSDEGGLAGVSVTLLSDSGEKIAQVETGRDGKATFNNLQPGNYRLSIALPEGRVFSGVEGDARPVASNDDRRGTTDLLSLSSGQTLDTLRYGATISCTVSGVVFDDLNGDGNQSDTEPGLDGVEVDLLQDGQVVYTTTTNAQGVYHFSGLRADTYQLRVTLPQGYIYTVQRPGGQGGVGSDMPTVNDRVATREVKLDVRQQDAAVNAGALRMVSIEASVWLDNEAAGADRGGEGYQGIQVELYGITDAAENLIASAQTDINGNATFRDLRPGTYRVNYRLPSQDWGFTSGIEQMVEGWGRGRVITLDTSETTKRIGAGLAKLGSIAGIVFVDDDYDGLRTDPYVGIQATVSLMDGFGTPIEQTTTDENGTYRFTGVLPGNYILHFELPSGYAFTKNRPDAPSYNSNVPETEEHIADTARMYLPAGETLLADAGAYQSASITGAVWQDVRGNGLYTSKNPPLAGVEIALMRGTEIYGDTITDADGVYTFSSLPPGEYSIRVKLPGGMFFTLQSYEEGRVSLILPTEANIGTTSVFQLAMGERKTQVDAGAIFAGSVTGTVHDGKNKGEGVSGVSVALIRGGAIISETVTDDDGNYRLEGAPAGSAEVKFTPPIDWLLTQGQSGTIQVDVPQQSVAQSIDITLVPQTVIVGFLWIDANFNGEFDPDEMPLEIALVALRKHASLDEDIESGSVIHIYGTKEDGKFRFDKLEPGYYSLRITPPQGVILNKGFETEIVELGNESTVEINVSAYVASFIMGHIWDDEDGNGMRADTDEPVEGVTVELIDANGDVVQERHTDADGTYLFNELPPIDCTVRVTLPDDYVFVESIEGGSRIASIEGRTGVTEQLSLEMGSSLVDIDVGMMRPGRVGDIVWIDENGNGLQDTTEPGAEGLTVTLWRIDAGGEQQAAETKTDANGLYRFDNVRPGKYRLTVAVGDKYVPTKPAQGLDEINSKLLWRAQDAVTTAEFAVPSGGKVLNMDLAVVTREMAEKFGWTIGSDGTITAP